MKKESSAIPLDVRAFAQSAGQRSASDPLQKYERLLQDVGEEAAEVPVEWSAQGELRPVTGGPGQIWLHLQAHTRLPMTCQRCLADVEVALEVDRSYRFVADEATAEAEDDEAEEDVLALDPEFDLAALIEDELLMEMPLVPVHDVCPSEVKFEAVDEGFDKAMADKPKPFAALAKLRGGGLE
ncbi:YceD family protein [Variovorax sp. HJSM1_2]|uniref:YceD family protein n=1 Tax=Variovorax sp. HJSM1_2 TaxID=3366263 RepID=UPI003BE675AF